MLITCFFWLSLVPPPIMDGGGWLKPNEAFGFTVVDGASGHGVTLLVCIDAGKRFLYIYDYARQKIRRIDDGRSGQDLICQTGVTDQGFFLVTPRSGKIHFLDRNGTYQTSLRFQDIENVTPDMTISAAFSYGSGQILCTYKYNKELNECRLGLIDLIEGNMETLTSRELGRSVLRAFWVPAGSSIYFIYADTGQIELIDPITYESLRIIRQPDPLVPMIKAGQDQMKSIERLGLYHQYFSYTMHHGDKLSIEYKEAGKKVAEKLLVLSGEQYRLKHTKIKPVGSFEDQVLHYNFYEKEFHQTQTEGE